jgi:MFS transporter, DHA2 family, multidrug resistance protein
MLVTVMQVLDVTVTNVALPHIQGSLSAGVDEVSWVLTSYLAANAVILPATGWLAGALGRKRFFLICTVMFTLASVLCGLAPNITTLLIARTLHGIGGGPLMPISQAIMWEIFPLRQRGMAMAAWGVGIMMAPIFGPTLGGWIADNWSWRWIFYINVPIGFVGFIVSSAVLFDPPYLKKPLRVDVVGLVLMAVGFLSLQLFLDQGERNEWFDSAFIVALAIVATVTLLGFLLRELTALEPILDLSVYGDRNFAASSLIMLIVMMGFFSSMVLLALFTQKVLGFDAWTSGLVLAPGGLGNLLSLVAAGRLITRLDQRWLLAVGCVLNAYATYAMSAVALDVDYWALAWPRFVQGVGVGFIFVPLNTVALATIPREKMGNAHRGPQRGAQPGRRDRRGPHDHAARAPQPAAPDHARQPHQRLGSRDERAPARVDRALRRPRHRRLHGRAPRPGPTLPGGDAPGPAPGLRRRFLAALRGVLPDPLPAAPAPPGPRGAGRQDLRAPGGRADHPARGVTRPGGSGQSADRLTVTVSAATASRSPASRRPSSRAPGRTSAATIT